MKAMAVKNTEFTVQPAHILAGSFAAVILAGTLLLYLPVSSAGESLSFVDALFTATSAVCVTGLSVKDTATFFSGSGKTIIAVLIQLGGLGIMTFSTLLLFVTGKRVSMRDTLVIQEGFHHSMPKNVRSLVARIFLYTFAIEATGAFLLFLSWKNKFPPLEAVFLSVFHSLSAFCNAGFSLFSDSCVSFRDDVWLNVVLMLLIVLGGTGFLVLHELGMALTRRLKGNKARLSVHARLVLTLSAVLTVVPFLLFLILEANHSLRGMTYPERILAALFQTVATRTAGFNSVDMSTLSLSTVFMIVILMFIGASPGSTGGGVKTTTIGVILAFLRTKISARDSVSLFRTSVPADSVGRAFTLMILAVAVIVGVVFLILIIHPQAVMSDVVFETVSAFGTVGLSVGMTQSLTTLGKITIIATMYVGRIGPLALLSIFARRNPAGRFEYAEEKIMIG